MPRLPSEPDHHDDHAELEDDIAEWTPSPLPPMGPDGGPVLAAATRSAIPAGQGLCDDGPMGRCARYHKLVVSIDAEVPSDGSAPAHVGRKTIHTCYPHAGIELDLGDQHVFECTRYTPDLIPDSAITRVTAPRTGSPSTPSNAPRANPRSSRASSGKRRAGRR